MRTVLSPNENQVTKLATWFPLRHKTVPKSFPTKARRRRGFLSQVKKGLYKYLEKIYNNLGTKRIFQLETAKTPELWLRGFLFRFVSRWLKPCHYQLLAIHPFAYKVCYDTCSKGDDEWNEYLQWETPPFRTRIGGGSSDIITSVLYFIKNFYI